MAVYKLFWKVVRLVELESVVSVSWCVTFWQRSLEVLLTEDGQGILVRLVIVVGHCSCVAKRRSDRRLSELVVSVNTSCARIFMARTKSSSYELIKVAFFPCVVFPDATKIT